MKPRDPRVAVLCALVLLAPACSSPSTPDPAASVHVQADLYSGRPNPEWDLAADDARQFLDRFNRLTSSRQPSVPAPVGLGYRGVRASVDSGGTSMQMSIAKAIVQVDAAGTTAGRQLDDPDRALERWLVETGRSALGSDVLDALLRDLAGE